MSQFIAASIILTGTINLNGPIDEVFKLFSPMGEKMWVPGWSPELIHPAGVDWQEGMIFRTQEEKGPAIWTVLQLDCAFHSVNYFRSEVNRYAAVVEVTCTALSARTTQARVTYHFIGLTEEGNAEIKAMTPTAYQEKMARWTKWINEYLASRVN
ncbi:MAG: hypothetical protein PHX83_13055 [Acidobacteriia bacterium]|nr:hypothetical protein [Terriglobia bacterium]